MREAARVTGIRAMVVTMVAALGVDLLNAAPLRQAESVAASITFLAQRQDEFHNRFPVYDDVSSAGNHFPAFAKIGRDAGVVATVNGSWPTQAHSGATSMRFQFVPRDSVDFGGFYMLNGVLSGTAPVANFGQVPNAGIDLSGAQSLTFWARGENGGEVIDFVVGGVGRHPTTGVVTAPYPDSSPRRLLHVALTTSWKKYAIDLSSSDLSYVLGGFGWSAASPVDKSTVTFYVDDVQFNLGPAALDRRMGEPRFLRSYLTADVQPDLANAARNKDADFDFVLRNSAYAYDNALALLAFLAEGSVDGVHRAKLIGEAFLYALGNDRHFGNDRVRSDYAAGDIALPPGWVVGGKSGTVPVAGFYDESKGQFFEIGQGSLDTGNNAWVMTALLGLYKQTLDARYKAAAGRIGTFIRAQYSAAGTFPGFLGGLESAESTTPMQRGYASVEHNLDTSAAFMLMASASGDASWATDAMKAQSFVNKLFDAATGCYLSGTTDNTHRNTNAWQIPVDVQAWSILSPGGAAPGRHGALLDCTKTRHGATADGFSGADFNNDRDGVWFEGSAHLALALRAAGRLADAERLRTMLMNAQAAVGFGDGGGMPAASHDGTSTGFNADASGPGACTTDPSQCTFKLFKRKHIGATAWQVFAQLGWNPYTQSVVIPLVPTASVTSGAMAKIGDTLTLNSAASSVPAGRAFAGYDWAIVSGDKAAAINGSASGSSVSIYIKAAGNIVIQLTVTDSAGASGSSSTTITVPGDSVGGGGGGGAFGVGWALGLAAAVALLWNTRWNAGRGHGTEGAGWPREQSRPSKRQAHKPHGQSTTFRRLKCSSKWPYPSQRH